MVVSNRSWIGMLVFAWLAFAASAAQAEDCSDYPGGVLDGFAGDIAPSQLQVDRNCTIRNFPASNPLNTNFSFFTQPGQNPDRWLIVFDNVVHTGQMSCNSVLEHKIWFTNGSSTAIQEGCQNLLIPVEKIDKQNPAGQITAAIGVPFTYTLTMPVLFDAGTGTVINGQGSLNDLHGVILTDDLNATGADLTYVSHIAYWRDSGSPVPHTFSNVGGVLTFDNFPIVPAGEQIILELTVVLDSSPANVIGTQFINTAKWEFGRLIDGVFYQPLPGEWGISPPLTIGGPDLTLTKSGPATLNLGESGDFSLDVQNAGNSDAFDLTIVDRFPDGPTGGTCDFIPFVLSAQVFEADGVTSVPGKGALAVGTDFSFTYSGAPSCEFTLNTLTSDSVVGPGERLIIAYRTELDPDTEQGAALTNLAGVIEWFNGASGNPNRQTHVRTLTNGTVGTLDHQDAFTVTADLSGYIFEKTVENLTTGVNPTTTAAPGDTLRYTLRLQTTDGALNNATFYDDLGVMNPLAVFEPGSLTVVPGTLPPGADTSNTDPNGGTNGAGILEIRNLSLPLDSELQVQFDITLAAALLDGTVVTNQADLIRTVKLADSDDPNVNGQADPDVPGDEDPTRVLIEAPPPPALQKSNTQATAAIGEEFRYRITVPSAPHKVPLYDVRIIDDLTVSAADLEFVDVTKVSGSGAWTPVNTGTSTNLIIEDPVNGIDIPAGEQVVVEVTVLLLDTSTNVAGLTFTNTAAYTYNQLDNNDATELTGDPGTTGPMTIVEPELTLEKSGPAQMREGVPGTFTLDVHNVGGVRAFATTITDVLPNTALGGMCNAAPDQVTAQIFQADGVTAVAPALTAGTDFAVTFDGDPACTLTLTMLTAAAAIGPDERLIVTYQASLDLGSELDAALTNVAGATEWFSDDGSAPNDQVRQYARPLTDGTVGVLDHEDAYTVVVFTDLLMFEKTVVNVTTGDSPALVATPGDTLRYSLYIENVGVATVDDFNLVDELDRLNTDPAFQPGTLTLVTVPAGADTTNTDAVGGTAGTGVLDIRNLSIGPGESLLIEFEVQLAPVLANASYAANQSQMMIGNLPVADSDDPNVNGQADPIIVGDEDPTRVQIQSAPYFDVDKISTYLDGDPAILLAGETLRYTITVKNIGTENTVDARLRDALPANTTYVADSTTLNGNPVADGAAGTLPLGGGIDLYAPEDPTPGTMRADASAMPDNVATIEFDVVVDTNVIDGTVISNQAFVSAVAGGVIDQPSDDPRTAVVDDPTRDVVGNFPLIFAEKAAALQVDGGSPGIVDPGDYLHYTIQVHNNGAVEATMVRLTDVAPTDTTYVADTLTLNGLPVGQPDDGVFPLEAGIWISSSDLTPPVPGPNEGVLTPGETATIEFDVRVDDAVPRGTLIVNQATVTTEELGTQLTDGDGNPATGPEPTVVVVGDAQQLSITKEVWVVGGGAAIAGATLEYLVTVENISAVPAIDVYITDDLDEPTPGYLLYVDQSASLNGDAAGISVAGPVITANYSAQYGPLAPGQSFVLRFQAQIEPTLPIGTTVTNVAHVTWNTDQTASASVSIDVGGMPGSGILNGAFWHDSDFDDAADSGELVLEGWTVELRRNDQVVHTTLTDAAGAYQIAGLVPNYLTQDTYDLTFRAPGAGANTALLGYADSDFTNALHRITDIVVLSGSNLQNLNLPIDPNGVVYDSISRTPLRGATLNLVNESTNAVLPAACFDDPGQQGQVTRNDGYYKFDLNFSDPSCPSGGTYVIELVEPGTGFESGYSEIIPPLTNATMPPLNVPACPGGVDDAVPATAAHCEVQVSEFAPSTAVMAQSTGTNYHVRFLLDRGQPPGSSQIFNNHIPLDPVLVGVVTISKTTPMVNVTRGQMVPYTIMFNNTYPIDLPNVDIVDRYPVGFKYIEGSARLDGEPLEPTWADRELVWQDLTLTAEGQHTIQLLLAPGAGVAEGKYVNRAQAVHNLTGNALSGEASATVRLVPDPTFDCTDVTGKVFDDRNRDGVQDNGEFGLSGVRLVTPRGLAALTDDHGRFHITCAITPREGRGSNFMLKLDDRTLPTGYRSSTEVFQIKRATRGKALHFKFGASLHRVIGLDVAGPVFEPGSTDLRPQWRPRLGLLMEELQKGPAILRLSYLADVEDPKLVERRIKAITGLVNDAWRDLDCCYRLVVEHEALREAGQ
jgi:uncharacterized repeat protein (TIGR01451 family)/fimbrial isopeptide formation D2 family protein